MQLHVYLIAACIVAVEIFLRSGFLSQLGCVISTAKKVSHVILEPRISDHWKEKMVPSYAFIILRHSLYILGVLLAIVLVFLGFSFLSDELLGFAVSIYGALESILIAMAYVKLRNLIVK